MDLAEKIGRNIKKIRIAKNISQGQLAHLTNLHQSQVYRFEKGKQPTNTIHLEKISIALGVPVIELLKTDPEIKDEGDDQELLEIIFRMPQIKKEELLKILRKLKNFDFSSLRKAIELVQDLKK